MSIAIGLGCMIFLIIWAICCWYQDHMEAQSMTDYEQSAYPCCTHCQGESGMNCVGTGHGTPCKRPLPDGSECPGSVRRVNNP